MAIPIYVSSINIRSPQVKLPPKNENISSLIFIPTSIIQVPCKFGYIRSPKDNLCRETVPLPSTLTCDVPCAIIKLACDALCPIVNLM
ncbi:hypothetical protein APICC_07298 [Apis cerana cerana]|uniref:Uncharacterized protein n=1 Tax=Apis cerana cerana TaxID=94128 RepID=A0A2A3E5J3_APICC|nr:hypothetical protein APICC_07298 [Apis cerana cerana]